MEKLISIVLPVYNGEKYLYDQIKSLTEQTYRNIEIIVIDDDSKDTSVKIANKFTVADKRVKVYKNISNLGLFFNCMKGLSLAKGEIMFFCDQDDCWRPDKIRALEELITKDAENMLVYSDLEICDEKLRCMHSSFWKATGIGPTGGSIKAEAFLKNIAPGCSMAFRKKVRDILVTLPLKEYFMHDHLALIISCGLGKIAYSREKLVKYRQHGANNIGAFYNSIINEDTIAESLKKKIDYFRENQVAGAMFDLDSLDGFVDSLRSKNPFKRIQFLRYYLFLRNNTIVDKLFGILQCLLPGFYSWLRNIAKNIGRNSFFVWIVRIVTITWFFIVLKTFFAGFVLHKVLTRLGA